VSARAAEATCSCAAFTAMHVRDSESPVHVAVMVMHVERRSLALADTRDLSRASGIRTVHK
jgi:hypothetical protein